jgi:hypothetical protein
MPENAIATVRMVLKPPSLMERGNKDIDEAMAHLVHW